MRENIEREKVRFASAGTECVAWHYPGTNGACVIMAGGAAVIKEPGTDRFARRFHEAGFTVLAFDYRRFGESGGRPRQIMRVREQLADWRTAIEYAAQLPGVDPSRIALWGFSLAGGHVLKLAAEDRRVAAVIAQTPLVDGQAIAPKALKFTTPSALLRLIGRAIADGLGALVGRRPLLIPAAGAYGTVAMLTTPDAMDGTRALDPDGRYTDWQQEVAARFVLRLGFYRPGRAAARITCPALVVACDDDTSVFPEPAIQVAERAPKATLVRLPGSHYAPFLGAHEQAVEAELAFLRRHLIDATQPASASVA